MTQDIGLRRTVMLAGVATLLIVALACTRTVEVPGETVVVEKEVVKTVEVKVPGETVTKEVVKTVQVPGETVVVEKEVVKTVEVEVPGETVVVKEQVVKTVEVPGQTVTKEVVKTVKVPGETVVVKEQVVKTVEVPGETVVVKETVEKIVVATPTSMIARPALVAPSLMAPESNPKGGGTLIYMMLADPSNFDPIQYGSTNLCTPMCPRYDKLMSLNPSDTERLPALDLAYSWDLSPDSLTYTFHIRDGVKFHDGGLLTSADVKASFDRIIFPPPGITSHKQVLFNAVKDINTPDDKTIQFVLWQPRSSAYFMDALAQGFNVVFRKETLDENDNDLARVKDAPGTGPFMFGEHIPGESWTLEKNPDYWIPGLPYLDRIEIFHSDPWIPQLAAALQTGRVDWIRTVDPKSMRDLENEPGIDTFWYAQTVGHALYFNNDAAPLDDARVRRAIHLILDREALVQIVADVTPVTFGAGFLFRPSPWATPEEELRQKPGYASTGNKDADIAEARRLLADAGHADGIGGLEIKIIAHPHAMLWGPAIQQLLKQTLSIDSEVITLQFAQYGEALSSRNYQMAVSARGVTSTDPGGYLRGWYGTGEAQNQTEYSNSEVDALLDQIDAELDAGRRLDLLRRLEAIVEEDAPFAPLGWEGMTDARQDYVRGHDPTYNTGIYNQEKRETVWLDK